MRYEVTIAKISGLRRPGARPPRPPGSINCGTSNLKYLSLRADRSIPRRNQLSWKKVGAGGRRTRAHTAPLFEGARPRHLGTRTAATTTRIYFQSFKADAVNEEEEEEEETLFRG